MNPAGNRPARPFGRAALAVAAGGVIGCSLPPLGPWFLAPIGLGALFVLLSGQSIGHRALFGALCGAGQFTIGCAFALEFTGLGYGALVAFESLLVGLACVAIPRRRARLVGFTAVVTVLEWVRDTWPFGGMPLGGIALSQASGPLADLARLGGPLLVVVATAAAGAGLLQIAGAAVSKWHGDRQALRTGVAGMVPIGVVAVVVALATVAPNGGRPGRLDSVAVVQGGGRRGVTSLEVPPTRSIAATAAVIDEIRPPVDLVVCPENALAIADPLSTSPEAARFGAFARRLQATLLAGVTRPVGSTRFVNEIVAFSPSGSVIARVEKAHPVPFGEYVPLRSLVDKVANLAAVPRDVVVGHNTGMIKTPVGRLATLNSFETFFSDRGRSGVRAGGELAVVETNTASYGTSQVPAMELAASRLQAISLGRTVVQSATTGYSAVISPDGVVERSGGLGRPDLIRAKVGLRSGWTLYDRFGDGWLLVVALVALAGSSLFEAAARRRGARQLSSTPLKDSPAR